VTSPSSIDVHAHYLPASYRTILQDAGHAQADGMPGLPEWSAAEHVMMMDRLGIGTAVLSVSSPGIHLADAVSAADLAREVNEAGRRAVVDHPGRFGLFASLPLPDVDAAMAEIAFCCDELAANGFVLLTHVDGTYLGDPSWEPVFAELDRRQSRVFIHPTSPPCWEHTSLGRPRPLLEFLFDTTRAVVNLILNGTVARCPDLAIIVPHAGATLPMIADRVAAFAPLLASDASVDVLRDLGGLHFDLAGFPVPRQLDALLALTTLEHLHYGSDYPFTPEAVVAGARQRLDGSGDPPGSLTDALWASSARLFPELSRAPS